MTDPVNGLRTLAVQPLCGPEASPLAFYSLVPRSCAATQEQRVIQVVLLDMNGTARGEVSLKLPEEALIDANNDACYIVRRHHSSGFGGSSGAMLEPLDDDSAIFCKRELIHGQLHASVPSHGVCSLQIIQMTSHDYRAEGTKDTEGTSELK